jgi:ABC-type multidrug transport system fused ATPase/permease subunit
MSDQAPSSRRSTSSSILNTPSATPSFTFGEERASSPSFSFDRPPIPLLTSSNQTPSSRKSTPSSICHTPPATASFTFGEERASSPSFSFDTPRSQVPAPSNRTISSSSNTTSSTLRYTPSSTPSFTFGEQHSAVSHDADLDPDIPLPSVERDAVSPNTSRYSTPNSIVYTPSVSTRASPGLNQGSLNEDLLNLRLGSSTPVATVEEPSRPAHQRNTSSTSSAPSIHITPTPSTVDSIHFRSNRTESLVHGISSLRMDNADQSPRSSDTDRLLGTPSPAVPSTRENANRSPSPSRRRRRSASGAGPIIHRVEDEDPPQALSRERRVQEALTSAKGVTARLARALSSSALHHERGSNIQSLHQQAIKLSEFQVPSSRIVGLVGDSGVGKSSLINSLLDKKDLARAVCSITSRLVIIYQY